MARVIVDPVTELVRRSQQTTSRLNGGRIQWAQQQLAVQTQANATIIQAGITASGLIQLVINDGSGNPIVITGQLGAGAYGMQILNNSGAVQLTLNADGIVVSDSSGNTILQCGKIGGKPALAVYDASANLRVQLGELPSGDYGVETWDTAGNHQAILPSVFGFDSAGGSATSGGWDTISGSPSVPAVIGASGNAIVAVSSYVGLSAAGVTAEIGLSIDGGTPTVWVTLSAQASAISGTQTFRAPLSELTGTISAGSHTFTLRYKTSSASISVDFANTLLEVQPI